MVTLTIFSRDLQLIMRLTIKVILIVGGLVTLLISIIFTTLIIRINQQNEQNILSSARSIYRNVLITRKWVSNYDGILVKKMTGMKPNPYLPNPELITENGDTLLLKNPALVTRELSELSNQMGGDFSYHMASQKYINPVNKPDEFEESALIFFHDTTLDKSNKEYYQIEEISGRHYFRYFAPLYTDQSCLHCHAAQGYKVGDIRGGISVLLAIDPYLEAQRSNLIFLIILAFLSISLLSALIFIAIQRSVIKPLRLIENSTHEIQEGNYNFQLNIPNKDEIGSLAQAFNTMGNRIQKSTDQLKASESKYRSLIEHSLESIAIIRPNGVIIDCNSKMINITGYSNSELKGSNFFNLIDEQNKKKIHGLTNTTVDKEISAVNYETTLYTKDGLEIPIEIYNIKGFSFEEEENLSFVYLRDLTERKKIEKYSIQTEKMFALGQLSSGIAHEIRNPLFALSNNINYLNKKMKDFTEFQEIYPELKNSIDRIHNIVSTILDYAKPHKPEFKKVNINEVIRKSLTLIKKQLEKSAIKIKTDFQEGDSTLEADPHQLEQVFLNLILNSLQAMGQVGELTIKTKSLRNFFLTTIQDTGKGIPKDELSRIFDPFFSTFPNGTGLGLAIVQRILDQHGARYFVESEENLGTTFSMHFPYKQG